MNRLSLVRIILCLSLILGMFNAGLAGEPQEQLKATTDKVLAIQVEYRTWKGGEHWLVYDFSVEGVSLINNYRTQFNEIISKSSFAELVKRLRDKSAN